MQSFKLEELRMPNYMKPLMPQRIAMGWDLRPHPKPRLAKHQPLQPKRHSPSEA